MSELIRLKGALSCGKFKPAPVKPSLYRKKPISVSHLKSLLASLIEQEKYYSNRTLIDDALICVSYHDIVPKSRRVSYLLDSGGNADRHIVGARYSREPELHHEMIYRIKKKELREAIERLNSIVSLCEAREEVDQMYLESAASYGKALFPGLGITGNKYTAILTDISNVASIHRPNFGLTTRTNDLVTIYDVGRSFEEILTKLRIPYSVGDVFDKHTVSLSEDSYRKLNDLAGYLIAMDTYTNENLMEESGGTRIEGERSIPKPGNEPTIGVIDTFFDDKVYFKEWVEVDESYTKLKPNLDDRVHATEVCSIIVDGPALNPSLEDGCGRFKVALFPVAIDGKNSWINIVQAIELIVLDHPTIKVWNLSLGSVKPINDNCASPAAALLDKLQADHPSLLFVVAGTNMRKGKPENRKIGAPADSINSLVVNAVRYDNDIPCYARKGPAMSFFRKPDLSYYGGDGEGGSHMRVVVTATKEGSQSGTSLAAPWIARKASFLIDKMGFSRDEAKALLIDSAIKNTLPAQRSHYLGHGIVPVDIRDVINPSSDEIRFIIKGTSETYSTYTYNIPIPSVDEGFPFKARAVMAAALHCDRNKGVDYSNEELALSYGRMKDGKIKTINGDKQDEEGSFTNEEAARSLFRKWDNIKVINEPLKTRRFSQKKYSDYWGLCITSKIRNSREGRPKTNFAVVITMTEIYGQDRSATFESLCMARGWIVEKVNVEERLHLYAESSADLSWK